MREIPHDVLPDGEALLKARHDALEEAAKLAESYEPRCESCPRGVADAIRRLKVHKEEVYVTSEKWGPNLIVLCAICGQNRDTCGHSPFPLLPTSRTS